MRDRVFQCQNGETIVVDLPYYWKRQAVASEIKASLFEFMQRIKGKDFTREEIEKILGDFAVAEVEKQLNAVYRGNY